MPGSAPDVEVHEPIGQGGRFLPEVGPAHGGAEVHQWLSTGSSCPAQDVEAGPPCSGAACLKGAVAGLPCRGVGR